MGEAELEEGLEPDAIEGESGLLEVTENVVEVLFQKVGQEKAIVELMAPGNQGCGVGLFPEPDDAGADEEHLQRS